MTLNHAFMAEVEEKRTKAERRDISKLKELLSDKDSNYGDAKRRIDEISLELNQVKTYLSKTKIKVEKYDYSSNLVAGMINSQVREKRVTGLGYSEVEPPFNHNYSSMPRINTSIDDLIFKSDRGHEFTTGSNKPASLIVDPDLTNMNCFDDYEVCVEKLSVIGQDEEKEDRSARKSTNCSVVFNKSNSSQN
ncbi:hypothetical protein R6Q57_005729 [Mikania cordata]